MLRSAFLDLKTFSIAVKINKMKKSILSFALPFLPFWAFCCSCVGYTTFCEMVTPTSDVVKVRVINGYFWPATPSQNYWIDVVVEEVLMGTSQADTMTILASMGTTCDPFSSEFEVGNQYIVRLTEKKLDGPTDWFTFHFDNPCKESFLRMQDNQVIGFIKDEYSSQSYQAFKDQLGSCVNFTRTLEERELEGNFTLVPNPTSGATEIYSAFLLEPYELSVFTTAGQLVFKEMVGKTSSHYLSMEDQPNGVYFIKIKLDKASITTRLVVQR